MGDRAITRERRYAPIPYRIPFVDEKPPLRIATIINVLSNKYIKIPILPLLNMFLIKSNKYILKLLCVYRDARLCF
jgi:hypothetical protein